MYKVSGKQAESLSAFARTRPNLQRVMNETIARGTFFEPRETMNAANEDGSNYRKRPNLVPPTLALALSSPRLTMV